MQELGRNDPQEHFEIGGGGEIKKKKKQQKPKNCTKITLQPNLYLGHLLHCAGAVLIALETSLPHLITPETTRSTDLKQKRLLLFAISWKELTALRSARGFMPWVLLLQWPGAESN